VCAQRAANNSRAHVHEPIRLRHRRRARRRRRDSDRLVVMSTGRADSIGMCVAGACAVHCIATPLIVGILPVVGLPLLGPRAEWLFLSCSLVLSSSAIFSGCIRHHRWLPVAIFVGGAAMLLASHTLVDDAGMAGRVAIVIGAASIICAHLLNIRLCQCTPHAPQCR
jgi:hypothetical protein